MLMAELATAVNFRLPVKVMVLKNNSLAEVRFEQTDLGYNVRGRVGGNRLRRLRQGLRRGGLPCGERQRFKVGDRRRVARPGPALIEVVVDPEEPPAMPGKLKV
jgi:pyruvate dehydrogenase (quinone)